MPKDFASKAQAKAFFAAAEGKGNKGIPVKTAKAAVAENKGKPIKALPNKVATKSKKY